MKKKSMMTSIAFVILIISVLIGCVPQTDDNGNGPKAVTASDYFPIRQNIQYIYEGYGNEYAAYRMTVDYTEEDKVQRRINNGGTEIVEIFIVSDDKVSKVYSRAETYFRENFLNRDFEDPEEIAIMDPIEVGTSWTSENSNVSTITNISADVDTPSGKYKALEITTEGPESKSIDYYVKDIGLVKTVYIGEDYEVSSALSSIEENTVFTQNVRFYYPNIDDGIYYYKDVDVSYKTNDITREILCNVYKEPVESENVPIGKVFSSNTEINSLYLNEDGMVYIDLNRAFLEEMNAGAGYEAMILQSIANTFGSYYNTEKVILTIDDALYESGHIAFQKGEYISVHVDNIRELR